MLKNRGNAVFLIINRGNSVLYRSFNSYACSIPSNILCAAKVDVVRRSGRESVIDQSGFATGTSYMKAFEELIGAIVKTNSLRIVTTAAPPTPRHCCLRRLVVNLDT